MVIEIPEGFKPHTIQFRREWRRVYVLTIGMDSARWNYRVDLRTKNAAIIGMFYQEIGGAPKPVKDGYGFEDPEAAANAAMIAARIDFAKRRKR